MAALLDYSERIVREEIRAMPDGVYEFTDYVDEDGMDPDPIPIRLKLEIRGDRVIADFSESAPQVRGSINCSLSVTKASTFTAVKCFCRQPFPPNSGFFRPIEVIAPEGTVLNVAFPGATFMRGLTIYRINNVLFGALARAMPERAIAADEGGTSIVVMEGTRRGQRALPLHGDDLRRMGRTRRCRRDRLRVERDRAAVEHAGRGARDRVSGARWCSTASCRIPAGRDATGAGCRWCASTATSPSAARFRCVPTGCGSRPMGSSAASPAGAAETGSIRTARTPTLAAKVKGRPLARGEVVRHVLAGGGGYGWPFERDVAAVVEDVRDGKVTRTPRAGSTASRSIPRRSRSTRPRRRACARALRAGADAARPPLCTQ